MARLKKENTGCERRLCDWKWEGALREASPVCPISHHLQRWRCKSSHVDTSPLPPKAEYERTSIGWKCSRKCLCRYSVTQSALALTRVIFAWRGEVYGFMMLNYSRRRSSHLLFFPSPPPPQLMPFACFRCGAACVPLTGHGDTPKHINSLIHSETRWFLPKYPVDCEKDGSHKSRPDS